MPPALHVHVFLLGFPTVHHLFLHRRGANGKLVMSVEKDDPPANRRAEESSEEGVEVVCVPPFCRRSTSSGISEGSSANAEDANADAELSRADLWGMMGVGLVDKLARPGMGMRTTTIRVGVTKCALSGATKKPPQAM
ncbi:uncharacterized protein MYCGRDRAFT_98018 [Zymoseptoria tritici IPO323]|uniref:Uncharacterized protein n=1 Tax=Zymoseptoria tritici (strain CBS 115943 / IPO323) TaxID=336722 RepID=F9XS29_ZYMTI|nr:uncharacterized protein MYCGRDRAFT_98018 [Zymoseptoria tritici IPO323]EGP81951.1 hypothetical protein MYCGRDRAFT_98018 [Zymoseptoria tritici IPO323]